MATGLAEPLQAKLTASYHQGCKRIQWPTCAPPYKKGELIFNPFSLRDFLH